MTAARIPPCINDADNPNRAEDLMMWVLSRLSEQERKQVLRAWTLGRQIERNRLAEMAAIAGLEFAP